MNGRHYVYILASKRHGALFVGCTEDLLAEVLDHKCNLRAGLTRQFAIHRLVFFEAFAARGEALARERALKALHRLWKIELIEGFNPAWRDLYDELTRMQEPALPAPGGDPGVTEFDDSMG